MFEAVVLSRRNFRESDILVSLYTKEKGKVEALARGVKKITSKNAALLEPYSCIFVGLVRGKEIDVITTTQSVSFFSEIRRDLQKSFAASQVVSWFDATVAFHEKDSGMYDLLFSWLYFLDTTEYKILLLDAFFMKCMIRLGFEPQLDVCAYCQKAWQDENTIIFSFAAGGIICRKDKIENNENLVFVFERSVFLGLRYILLRSWREVSAFENPALYKNLHDFVLQYISYYTEKKMPDWENSFVLGDSKSL